MTDRSVLRLSATLVFVGLLVWIVAGLLHPAREQANNHPAVFAEYAASASWTAVHLGQFVGMAVLVAGLVVLSAALHVHTGASQWANRFGAIAALVALGLYGVLQAIDGVALKQVVDAWVSAPDAEKAARFASAETVRWLEWAVRGYQNFMLGVALVLFASVIVSTARLPRPLGYLMGLSGLAYFVHGWLVSMEGFSPANGIPTLLPIILSFAWTLWLLVYAWRMKDTEGDTTRPQGIDETAMPI